MDYKNCLICEQKFFKEVTRSKKSWGFAKFCSRKCYQLNWKKTVLIDIKNRDSRQLFKCDICKKEFRDYYSNLKPYKYKTCSVSCRHELNSLIRKMWFGDRREYKKIHKYINKIKGKAEECIQCCDNTKSRYHWANISGNYLLDPNDYESLCPSCHAKIDLSKVIERTGGFLYG